MLKKIICVFLLSFLTSSCTSSAPIWHMVNCNTSSQGDCHLLEDNSVFTMIDSGESHIAAEVLIPYLKSRGISEIKHFFISHPHTDHYGGLEPLSSSGIKIKNIYYNAPPPDVSDWNYKLKEFERVLERHKSKGTLIHNIQAGFTLNLPNSKIYVLEAKKEPQKEVNDYSLIMAWDAGGYRTLFTGDLSTNLGTELAKREELKADILKVPHHGVTGIAPDEFFDNVNPSLLMLPGHERLWYDARGSQVRAWAIKNWTNRKTHACSNGFNGDVRISFYKDSIEIDSETPNETCPQKVWFLEPIEKPILSN